MSRREQHVRELAAELGIDLHLIPGPCPEQGGVAGEAGRGYHSDWDCSVAYDVPNRGDRWAVVKGWDGRSQLGYFAALHEMGHHAIGDLPDNPHSPARRFPVLESEGRAWLWALEQAREEPGRVMKRQMRDNWLGTYIRWGDRSALASSPACTAVASRFGLIV